METSLIEFHADVNHYRKAEASQIAGNSYV